MTEHRHIIQKRVHLYMRPRADPHTCPVLALSASVSFPTSGFLGFLLSFSSAVVDCLDAVQTPGLLLKQKDTYVLSETPQPPRTLTLNHSPSKSGHAAVLQSLDAAVWHGL